MLVTKQLTVAIDVKCIRFPIMEVNGCSQLFGYQHVWKYPQVVPNL